MIFDVDMDAIAGCISIQRDFGMIARKLERIIQQVADRGEKHSLVGINRKFTCRVWRHSFHPHEGCVDT